MKPARERYAAHGLARGPWSARRLELAFGAVLLAGTRAPADVVGFPSLYPFCTEQVQVFRSLRHGEFDYCKLHLRYVPGSTDCLRIVATACNGWDPGAEARVLRQAEDGRAERIICPPGPPPPSCPAGYPAGPIPRAW